MRVGRDIADSRLELACQNFHQGRLSGTVCTDQAIAIAIAEGHGNVLEQGLGAELNRQI